MKTHLYTLCIVVLGLAGCRGLSKGAVSPNFELRNLTGQAVTLEQYRGRAVLLSFWSLNSDSHTKQLETLATIQSDFGDKGLRVLAINSRDESSRAISRLAAELDAPFMVLLRGQQVFSGDYRGKELPQSYLIDHDGKIQESYRGWDEETSEEMYDDVLELLDDYFEDLDD